MDLLVNSKCEEAIAYLVSGNGSCCYVFDEDGIDYWVDFYAARKQKVYVFRKEEDGQVRSTDV
jgi:hypothetical protein